MSFTLLDGQTIRRDADGACFLPDPGSDLPIQEEFRAWTEAGNAPAPLPGLPVPPRQQLGGVFLGAVADLGWWEWFDQGAAAQAVPAPNGPGKPLDQRYWTSLGKADTVLVADAKLNRVAKAAEAARVAASGQPAPAAPIISMSAVMDHGDAMLKAGS